MAKKNLHMILKWILSFINIDMFCNAEELTLRSKSSLYLETLKCVVDFKTWVYFT